MVRCSVMDQTPKWGGFDFRVVDEFGSGSGKREHAVFHHVGPIHDGKHRTGKLFTQQHGNSRLPVQGHNGVHHSLFASWDSNPEAARPATEAWGGPPTPCRWPASAALRRSKSRLSVFSTWQEAERAWKTKSMVSRISAPGAQITGNFEIFDEVAFGKNGVPFPGRARSLFEPGSLGEVSVMSSPLYIMFP